MVLWKQRDLQDFVVTHDLLLAGGGDRLPRHAVDLVEGMRAKVAVVCGADEQQHVDRLLAESTQLQAGAQLGHFGGLSVMRRHFVGRYIVPGIIMRPFYTTDIMIIKVHPILLHNNAGTSNQRAVSIHNKTIRK